MSSIDDRIVQMKFDNNQFQKGVSQTNDSLDQLKDHLQLNGATKGLNSVQSAADKMNLGSVADGVDHISRAFSALSIIGITVLAKLTTGAMDMAKSLIGKVLDPIFSGGNKRSLALEQANFQFKGLGLNIEKTMAASLKAVKGTAFGLDDAATAAAQFGASGITAGHGLESSLRSIAGVAAQTGSQYSDVANIFETVAGNGRLMGQDLLSLSSRGVNAAATIGKSIGKSESQVRDMVSKGQISFKMFSDAMNNAFGANAAKANNTFSGALDNMHAALSRIGASIATPKYVALRKILNAITPVIDNIHDAIEPLIDAFGELENVKAENLSEFLDKLNLDGLETLGKGLVPSMKNLMSALDSIIKPLKDAFLQIFPPASIADILKITNAIAQFTKGLILTKSEGSDLQKTFAGFFAILDIGWQIFSRLIKVFADLLGFSTLGAGGILSFTGAIGGFLVKVDSAVKSGHVLDNFFNGLENVLRVPIVIIKLFAQALEFVIDAIEKLVTRNSVNKFADNMDSRFSGLIKVGQFFTAVWKGIVKVFDLVMKFMGPVFDVIDVALKTVTTNVVHALSSLKFDQVLQLINTALFGGFLALLNSFFGSFSGVLKGNSLSITFLFRKVFGQLRVNLKALEINTNAKTLKEIAISVALLAASAVALSLVNPIRLGAAMGALTVAFGQLMGSFKLLTLSVGNGKTGSLKLLAFALSLDLISGALLTLAAAIAILALVPIDRLVASTTALTVVLGAMVGAVALLGKAKGNILLGAATIVILANSMVVLAGAVAILSAFPLKRLIAGTSAFVVVLGSVVGAVALLQKDQKGTAIAAASILILSVAMAALAGAVAIFASLGLNKLIQGVSAFTLVLAEMVGVVSVLKHDQKGTLAAVGALLILGVAMNAMAGAIAILGHLSLDSIVKGLFSLAGILAILAISMDSMEGSIPGAAAMVIASAAILIMSEAFKEFSNLSWDDIGKAMVALAGSLAILVVAMLLMGDPIVLLGAAALIIAAGALAIIAPALALLGTISWDSIGSGLSALGLAIAVLAVGGVLLIPAIPGLLGMGAAVLLIGAGALAAGVGITLFAAALGVIAVVGAGVLQLIGPAIQAFADKIPLVAAKIGEGIGAFAKVIATQGPAMTAAITTVLLSLIAAFVKVIPPLIAAGTLLVMKLVRALVKLIPFLVDAGMKMVIGILDGVGKNIGKIVTKGTDIIVNFIKGVGNSIPRLLKAGANLIIKFINGLADTIRTKTAAINRAGSNLAGAIIDGMTSGLRNAVGTVMRAAQHLVSFIPLAIRKFLHIASPSKVTTKLGEYTGQGLADGLDNMTKVVSTSATGIGDTAVSALQKSISDISDAVNSNVDIQPSIRPVLDLSAVKKGATQIGGMLKNQTLSLDNVTANAKSVSVGYETAQRVATDADGQPVGDGTTINFTQNNNSPKALSAVEIYRQTKSQLAVAKGEINK